jgi:hypothetical protein
MGNAAP